MILGKKVCVIVDRPLGSCHPKHKNILYPVNYGYVEGILGGDGEEQDAYILGVNVPVESFTGKVIAIIHRIDDVEDKWVVAAEDYHCSKSDIINSIYFQEKYFQFWIESIFE